MLYTIRKNLKAIIIVLVAIVFVAGIILYDQLTTKDHYLTCTFENETYQEKMVFKFYDQVLIEFFRDEYALTTPSDEEELYNKYMEKGKELEKDNYFQYTVSKEKNMINAHTYIYLPMRSEIFNEFFPDEYEIRRSSSMDHLQETFEGKEYKCTRS